MTNKILRTIVSIVLIVFVSYSNGLAQEEVKVEEGYKSINGTEIFYKRMGDGEPIIIVHGGPVLEHGYLVPYLKPLSENYELIFFDQRLSGRSSADVDSSDVRLDQFVDDIEALRRVLKVGKFHLVAHSWGGLLAMNYAIKYSENLRSLILLNSMPASSKLWREEEQLLTQKITEEDSAKRQAIINSEPFKKNRPKAIEQLLILSFRNQFFNPSLADSLEFYIPDDYMIRSRRFGHMMRDISNYDLHTALSSTDVPTLILYGEMEPAVSVSASELNNTIPNSRLSIIRESGHFPFIEKSQKFLTELRNVLVEN